jgi:hypothetical protein
VREWRNQAGSSAIFAVACVTEGTWRVLVGNRLDVLENQQDSFGQPLDARASDHVNRRLI